MARKPDTVCAGGCGRLLWGGRTSLPAGKRTCRPCRRQRAIEAADRLTSSPTPPATPERTHHV